MDLTQFLAWFPDSEEYDTRIEVFVQMAGAEELPEPGVILPAPVQEPGTYSAE